MGRLIISTDSQVTIDNNHSLGADNNIVSISESKINITHNATTKQKISLNTKRSELNVVAGKTWTITTDRRSNADYQDLSKFIDNYAFRSDRNSGFIKKGDGTVVIDMPGIMFDVPSQTFRPDTELNLAAYISGPLHILGGVVYVKGKNILQGAARDTITFDNGGVFHFGSSQSFTRNGVVNAGGGGVLTVRSGGQVDGNLSGPGTLKLAGGTLSLTQDNARFEGVTDISDKAVARINTAAGLEGDASRTDRLVIAGDTGGSSDLVVKNTGGAGQQTQDGIKVIEVGGNSAGTFSLKGRVVAGAYEYLLHQGGIYGTWYQDADTLDGAYVDSWVQYSRMKATVNGEQLAGESYRLNGVTASVEGGYRLPVWQGTDGTVFVTPQAQVIRSGIRADAFTDSNGTRIRAAGAGNIQTRMGVKVSRDGVSSRERGTGRLFTVYAEANWLNNSKQAGATLDDVTVRQAGSRNIGELKLGVEGKINKHLDLWGNAAQQLGDAGYSDTSVLVGVRYRF